MRLKNNIYDYILIILIGLLAFGNYGNGAQPARLLIVALMPIMVVGLVRHPSSTAYYYKYESFFLLAWWLWSLAFLYKAEELSESIKHQIYLFIHIFGVLEVFWLANKATDPQRSLQRGWILLLIITLPIAINEFITDTHLSNSLRDSGAVMKYGHISIERPFAAVSFGNLNSYNTVLCWALPSLFFFNLYPKYKSDQIIGYILLFLVIVVIVANASRGAILCLGVMIMTYIYAYYQTGRNRVALIAIVSLISIVFVYYLFDIFFVILKRFSTQGMQDTGRVENIVKGLAALFDSGGLGIGIGNYGPIMKLIYKVRFAAPHNLLLEVLVCFGLPVFIGFVWMLVRLYRFGKSGDTINKNMLLFSSAAFLFAGIVDSNYLMKVPTWMFLATTYIYVDKRYNKKNKILV